MRVQIFSEFYFILNYSQFQLTRFKFITSIINPAIDSKSTCFKEKNYLLWSIFSWLSKYIDQDNSQLRIKNIMVLRELRTIFTRFLRLMKFPTSLSKTDSWHEYNKNLKPVTGGFFYSDDICQHYQGEVKQIIH